jgi:hypothetical protein
MGLFGILTSCNDGFLDRTPMNAINDGGFWTSVADIKMYANNFYMQTALMPAYEGWFGGYLVGEPTLGADDLVATNYNRQMNGENILPGSGGDWSAGDWWQLRNINYFFSKVGEVEASFDEYKQYVGEALYFRAWFYYNKLQRFGDVPYTDKLVEIGSDELYLPRTPRNEVVDHILVDLDNAIEYLPARAGAAWNGRITKEAALQFKSRVALFEGTWEKYHAIKNTAFKVSGSDGTKFLQAAADAAGALIDLSEQNGYPGLDNVGADWGYKNVFAQDDYTNSKEIMVWRKYVWGEITNTHVYVNRLSTDRGLTKSHVDYYLCTDGKPASVSPLYQGDHTLLDAVTNRDPRLVQSIWFDDGRHYFTDWGNVKRYWKFPRVSGAEVSEITGYCWFKFAVMDYDLNSHFTSECQTAFIIMRYAEALLNYAEAKAELGTITQSDIDKTINLLRDRVGMPHLNLSDIATDPNWMFKDISPVLQEIRRERQIELVGEGFRHWDLFRWAAVDEVMIGKRPYGAYKQQFVDMKDEIESVNVSLYDDIVNADANEDGYFDPYKKFGFDGYHFNLGRDYLSPLPVDQLVLNPALTQNPGW